VAGVADFQRLLAGELIVPASDAFGPCLQRRTLSRAQAGLGFADRSLIIEPYTVMGLAAGSPAAQAGLREGDRILRWRGAERSNLHSTPSFVLAPTVTVEVEREGRVTPISFTTRGAPVTQYKWRLKRGAKACAIPPSRQ
ncbi:MAG: hypothetical protein KIS90_09320, partial [Phenylobacterium sp.]|nr:hypothetical protein [Phenylobacterium sp.]